MLSSGFAKLIKLFSSVSFEHVPRSDNKRAEALPTLASKVDIREDVAEVKVIKNTLRAAAMKFIPPQTIDKGDWRRSVMQNLLQASSTTSVKEHKDFTVGEGELHYRGNRGILVRAILEEEARVELECVHDLSCGDNDIGLYRRLQKYGYY